VKSFTIKTVCISRYQHHPLAAKNVVSSSFFLLSTCWNGSCVIMQKRTSGSSDRKTFAEVQDNDIARLPQFTFAKVVRTFMFFIIKITSTWPAIQRDQLVTVTAASSWYGNDIAWLSRPGAFYLTSQPPRNMQNARPISTCYYMIFSCIWHTPSVLLRMKPQPSRLPIGSNAKVQLPQCCLGGLRDVCTSVCLVISVLDVRNPASSRPSGV
jgi:hypothetical protein